MEELKQDIVIVSFSNNRAGGFDGECQRRNILFKSVLWLKNRQINWVDQLISPNDEFENVFETFKVDDCIEKITKNLLEKQIKNNPTFIKSKGSINWPLLFKHIDMHKESSNNLIEKIDKMLLNNKDKDCRFIGFDKFGEMELYYFNTDQLYSENETQEKKSYFPDFLVQAWCDAYNKDPGDYRFKLVIHDKEMDGYLATAPKYYRYHCELRNYDINKHIIKPCRIVTFEHSTDDILFEAFFIHKDLEKIKEIFNNNSFDDYDQKKGVQKCSEASKSQTLLVADNTDTLKSESNLLNVYRLSKSGGANVLNYIIEELQNSILEMTLSKSKSETTIKLAEYDDEDIVALIKMISPFHSIIEEVLSEKKVIVSERNIKEFHIYLCSILEKIKI